MELQEAKDKYEEVREARQEAVRELLTLQDQHQEELRLLRQDLQDESNSREAMDRRLNDLRTEVKICLFQLLFKNLNLNYIVYNNSVSRNLYF